MTTTGSPIIQQPPQPPPPPPPRRWPRRHPWWTAFIAVVALVVLGTAIGTLGGSNSGTGSPSLTPNAANPAVSSAPASQPPAPAPTPSPDGTYTGSGDYVLSPELYGNDYLVGEVDLTNTGNVGMVVRVRFSWPQEGMPPIVAHKTVRVPYGHSKTVRFHVSAGNVSNSNVIDLLQSWQEGHNYRDGYKWKATIIDTFGRVH